MKALIVVDVDDIQRWTHAKVYLAHKDEEGDGWWADWEYKTYPLRPMPTKLDLNRYPKGQQSYDIAHGYNICLDEIMGK